MTDKVIHFMAGLPRSGSTLLCNILNQNPRFHATSTSGILDIVLAIRNQWENVNEFRASPNKEGKNAVVKGILQNYYSTIERPVIFDKSRGWCGYIELAEHILERKIKILVPVRTITDILASFEQLWRIQAHEWQFPQEKSNYYEWQTVEGRADVWMKNDQPVGIAYNKIRDALSRGFADRMLFVEFENLTSAPEETMKQIYNFLEEDYYKHNFNHVIQTTSENDDIHGIPGLHTIRPVVKPVISNAADVLGKSVIGKYSNAEFWR
jgi:sulfotransferase